MPITDEPDFLFEKSAFGTLNSLASGLVGAKPSTPSASNRIDVLDTSP